MKIRLFIILCLLGTTSAFAQTIQQERRIEEEKRLSLDHVEKEFQTHWQRWVFEGGGWHNYRYTDFHDDDNDANAKDSIDDSLDIDVRLWFKATLKPPEGADYDNEHVFYVRLKHAYTELYGSSDFNNYDHDGPHVDYAYGILDFDPFWVEVGRKYFSIGRGIAYSNVNDGIQLNYKVPGWNVGVFASHTLPHEDNIDTSVPGFDKRSDRYFYGVGVGYGGIKGHTVYGYSLIQRDFSDEDPIDSDQQYTYDSEYYGLGATGEFVFNSTYWAEVIRQKGEGFMFGPNTQADVDAWAVDLGLERSFEKFLPSVFSLEYAYGSGDGDRTDVTDTEFGNSSGDDDNFLYFGYIPTGLALAPRLSNLHMYRVGLEVRPFDRVSVQLNYFRFLKDKKTGGIFDLDATESSLDVGHEFDVEVSVQILSDLDMTVEYGHFMPGDAYPTTTNNNEDYLSVSMTHTF